MLIRFSGTVSSNLTFVWKFWEQGGTQCFTFIWHCSILSFFYSFHSFVHFPLSTWSILTHFFLAGFFSFHFVLFVVFISPHPLGCLHAPPSVLFLSCIFFLAPHGMLSFGVQEGDALKTLTGYNTLRDTQQCGPVNASILSAAQQSFCGPSCLDLPKWR